MAHPAVYVAAAVVIGVAAFIGFLSAASEKPQKVHSRGSSGCGSRRRPPSPPPSPVLMPSPPRRRRRSPQRRSNLPERTATSTNSQPVTCRGCNKSPYITVQPCNHESLCRGCFEYRLANNDTCPDCLGRIDSLSPSILPYGKCRSCRKFTELFKFLDCKHSLSLCIKCFEEQNISYRNCPECGEKIKGSEPRCNTLGTCGVCEEFKQIAKFQPCGHGSFCRRCASFYLESSGHECSECGRRVTEIS